MTSREDIERLLNQTGRTLKVLPNSYSVQEVDSRFKEIAGRWRFGDLVLHQSDVIELLIGALKDALELKWISVKERLPEFDDWVAVWYMDKDGNYFPTVGVYRDGGDGLTYWETDVDMSERAYPPEKITHWMPMPEPPKDTKVEEA